MTKRTQHLSAVSPVIGVILMVAITVLLAGVISVFVFGMASHVSKPQLTSVLADENSVKVTFKTTDGAVLRYQNGTLYAVCTRESCSRDGFASLVEGHWYDVVPGHCYNATSWQEVECW